MIRKIKKKVKKETDRYLKNNKEKMISFYEDSARKRNSLRAAPAFCVLLLLCIVLISSVLLLPNAFKKEPAQSHELPKLKKADDVTIFSIYVMSSHIMEVFQYPDVDFNNISRLPVYEAVLSDDSIELGNSVLEHFDIKNTRIVKRNKFPIYDNVTIELSSDDGGKKGFNITAYNTNTLEIWYINDINNMDLGFNTPTDTDYNVLQYIKEYVKEHIELFGIETPEASIQYSYKTEALRADYTVLVTDKPLESDYDKVLSFNNLSRRIFFEFGVSNKSKSLKVKMGYCDKYIRLGDDYDIISKEEAYDLVRSGIGKLYEGDHDPSNINVSEDTITETYIFYAYDNNGYYRPIYVIKLLTATNKTYSMWVDAIDAKHIE